MNKLSPIKRKFYQKNLLYWARDRLGVPIETLKWSLADVEAYKESGRLDEDGNIVLEAWDGTPDPFAYAMHALETGWKEDKRGIAMESGTGTGKTYFAAVTVLWWLDVFGDVDKPDDGCIVITLAPKEDQLKDNLWKEIDTLKPRFLRLHPQAEFMSLEIRMGRKNWNAKGRAVGVGKDEIVATKAAGYHAKHMLYVLEETPGIHSAIIETMDNTLTGPHNIFLALGNPDSVSDALHKLATRENVIDIRISAYDHPNVVLKNPDFISGAVSISSIMNRLEKYKEEIHPMYMSRVRGICPDTVSQCLFRPNALMAAKKHLMDPIKVIDLDGPITEGTIKIYYEVQHTHLNRYIIFVDPAGDAGNRDWHATVVMDRLRKRPAAVLHMRGPRDLMIKRVLELAHLYKVKWTEMSIPGDDRFYYALLNWERRGVGALSLSEDVVRYPALYYSRNIEVPNANLRAAMGWDTNSKTRKDMINELETWGLTLFEAPYTVVDSDLHDEMKFFVWVPRGVQGSGRFEAAPGHHDDIVMAWAGCLMTDKVIGPVVQQQKPEIINVTWEPDFQRYKKRQTKRDRWDSVKIPDSF
jgi:hypothetical protein